MSWSPDPLMTLGKSLGIGRAVWAGREEWEKITAPQKRPASSKERDLPFTVDDLTAAKDDLLAVCHAYGQALELTLDLAEDPRSYPGASRTLELAKCVREGRGAAELEGFLTPFARISGEVAINLYLTLDKTRLANGFLDGNPGVAGTVFFFLEAFSRWFERVADLESLEEHWERWERGAGKWVVFLPEWRAGQPPDRRLLAGPYLTLFGGDPADLPVSEATWSPPEPTAAAVYEARRDHLRWDERWLERLTPLHLAVGGEVPADDPVVAALRWQLAVLCVLYTADSVRRERPASAAGGEVEGDWIAIFRGVERRVPVRLLDAEVAAAVSPGGLADEQLQGVGAWAGLVRWAYTGHHVSDRLAVLQNVVSREVWGVDPAQAFRDLLVRLPSIVEQVHHSWLAFVEGKVDAFFAQAQSLEDHVAGAIRAFAEQTSELLKRLSETMLAAVAVVLAALVLPAARTGEVDLRVLWWGILVYALYVVCFPFGYGMVLQWQEHCAASQSFEERYQRFRRQLPASWIEAVGREPVDRSVRRYQVWFWLTVAAYVGLLAALAVALAVLGVLLTLRS